MTWPLSQDYNEAIQSPKSNFADPDLRRGEAAANALGLPMPYSGNFADVYQVRCPDGKSWAVKCFTRHAEGLRERYQEISRHLGQAKLPFTVDFAYLEQGIRVAGKWYPALKMQWVEGLTLNQFVAQYLDKPAMLEALLQLWARMGKYLRAADVAHCDLQHGNVLLVPGATPNSLALKLIDYDGMWAPALAGKKSGEVGHPCYQHPQRLREGTYSLEVDRFPLLLVATALRALKARKALWEKYDNGDNLLFKESDLRDPGQAAVFQELAALPDPGLAVLAAHVRAALMGGVESAPLLEEAMPDVRPVPPAPAKARPAAAPPRASAVQKTVPMAAPVTAPVLDDALAFDDSGATAAASFVRKKAKSKAKPKSAAARVPTAAWVGGGVALAFVAVLATGLTVWALSGKSAAPTPPRPDNHLAQENAGGPSPVAPRKDENGPPSSRDGNPNEPINPVPSPPPVVKAPDAPAQSGGLVAFGSDWDKVDPDGDCKFTPQKDALAIAVPAKDHELVPDRGRMDAPRLLRDVAGDFTAQVAVSGDFRPSGPSTALNNVTHTGAGLVVMDGDRNYIQLERLEFLVGGRQQNGEILWALTRDGRSVEAGNIAWDSGQGGPTHLKLARQGGRLRAWASSDGVQWKELPPLDANFGPKLKVGMVASTTSAAPFEARFEDFRLTGEGAKPLAESSPGAPLPFDSGWDKVDPDRDCKFTPDKGRLTIEAPAKAHDLSVEFGRMNAPRLLRDVDGDFLAQVQVSGEFHPSPPSTAPPNSPFVGAGLVLMDGDRTYARLEVDSVAGGDKIRRYANWELRLDGKNAFGIAQPSPEDRPTGLRLERQGDRLLASFSQDGASWTKLKPLDVKLRPKLKLGVSLITTSSGPSKAHFEDFRLSGGGVKAPAEVKAARVNPPAEADFAKEIKALKEEHKTEYAKDAPKDRAALSAALHAEADDAKVKPARRYALLVEARDLAARGDDPAGAVRIAEETAEAFDVNPREAKATALRAAGKTFGGRAVAKAYLDAALPLLREAREADDYDLVAPLLDAVRQAANDAADPAASKAAFALAKEMGDLQAAFNAVRPALQTLKEKPDDPDANLALGAFYCFTKNDWDKGLPLLAKGGDAALADAAAKDAAGPAAAADRLAAADAWWKAADADPVRKTLLQRRALLWYDRALPDLDDKDEERVKTRVIELCKTFPDFATAWADLDVSKCDVVGNCCLHLTQGQTLTLKQPATGELKVEAVVRCPNPHTRFAFPQSGQEAFCEWDVVDNSVGVSWISKRGGRPSRFEFPIRLTPDQWTHYTCTLNAAGTVYNADGKYNYSVPAGFMNETSQARKFQIKALDKQPVEVKSFTAKPAKQ